MSLRGSTTGSLGGSFAERACRAGVLLLVCAAASARAQVQVTTSERLTFDRPEAWAMAYSSSEALPVGLGGPPRVELWSLSLQLEGGYLPYLSDEQRTIGFNGIKAENINHTHFFGRPRLVLGLPESVSLMVAWVPPITVNGLRPNLFSGSAGWAAVRQGPVRLGVNAFVLIGDTTGDFTCSAAEAATQDPFVNPLGCTQASGRDPNAVRGLRARRWVPDRIAPWARAARVDRPDLYGAGVRYPRPVQRSRGQLSPHHQRLDLCVHHRGWISVQPRASPHGRRVLLAALDPEVGWSRGESMGCSTRARCSNGGSSERWRL